MNSSIWFICTRFHRNHPIHSNLFERILHFFYAQLWHSKKFLLIFNKNFVGFWKRGHFNFFQKTSLLKTFTLGKDFHFYILFKSGVWIMETFLLNSSPLKCIFEFWLFSFKRKNPRSFWGFSHFEKNHSWFYSASCGKTFPKPLPPFWAIKNFLFQQVQTIFEFYFNYFISQINSFIYFEPRWFSKQVPYCLWVLISNQLLWIVLSTHNLEPSRSTLLLFEFFKFQPLQVWTRFVKFDEIHIFSSPKIPPKFRQPPDALRGHPTKIQLKESLPHTKIILSNT